jgi:hypothetical protein
MNKDDLDDKYQRGFKLMPKDAPEGWCPPCPRCNGEMKPWDCWLVTGATCTVCSWNMSEGTGCLV